MRRICFCLFLLSLIPVAATAQAPSSPKRISGVVTVHPNQDTLDVENSDDLERQAQDAFERGEHEHAISLFIGACLKTSLHNCDRAQSLIHQNTETAISPDLQIILHHKACLYGREIACRALETFIARADAGCAANQAAACVEAGTYRLLDKGIGGDHDGGTKDFAKACDLGHRDACHRYAGFLAAGWNGDKDPEAAKDAFERSCAETQAENCTLAGLHYAHGAPEDRDQSVAGAFLKKGCDYGDAFACEELEMLNP